MGLIDSIFAFQDLFASPVSWLGIAFLIGLVHALDADHVMAVSVLATGDRGARGGLGEGLRWSIGHGVVVLAAGTGALLLGVVISPALASLAERAVGALMVVLGAGVWIGLLRRGVHIHFHEHDGLPPHAHWHRHGDRGEHPARYGHHHVHTASLVGALHGLAGSAPVVALLPVASRSPALGVAYLFVFGLGVGLAMALVSGLLGHAVERLSTHSQTSILVALRAASGAGSIGLGGWLVTTG
jgi:hypothetical protein